MFVDTLVIGNGFAGRTVARELAGEALILERGEKFNIFERRQRFMEMEKTDRHFALIRDSYTSKHAFNVPEEMPADCRSDYILVDGGCSNHWGGLSFRLSENVFSKQDSNFPWPFSYSSLKLYYDRAEILLRLSADPLDPEERNPLSAIKGTSNWRNALGKYFPASYIGAQAHNLSTEDSEGQGQCLGAGDCELCPMDAKTRSLHVKTNTRVLNGVMVDKLRFEGDKAVEAICVTKDGPLSIRFNRVVVAAHGIESMKLLWKSNLPPETPVHLFGHHYQDHAVAELACVLPGVNIPFFQLNTAAQVVIPELSGEIDGVEFTTLGMMTTPTERALSGSLDIGKVNEWKLQEAVSDMASTLGLYVLLEIPPEWDVSFSYVNGKVSLDTSAYHKNKIAYNAVITKIYKSLESLGAKPIPAAENRHYMKNFGTHHLVGMLSMGDGPRAVVDADFKLKGTNNVRIAGSSLFPRCGSRNPTVTVVATSLMLAEKLNAEASESLLTRAG